MPLTHNINRLSDISYLVSIALDNEDALDMKSEFDRDDLERFNETTQKEGDQL